LYLNDRSFVIFDDPLQALKYHGKRIEIDGLVSRSYLKKIPNSGGLISSLRDSIEQILAKDYDQLVPWEGVVEMKMNAWIDAKFTCFEKSFAKICLVSPIFPGWRSSITRWVDVEGHESEFLNNKVLDNMLDQIGHYCSKEQQHKELKFKITKLIDVADEKSHLCRNFHQVTMIEKPCLK